jgi:hypothetical protein
MKTTRLFAGIVTLSLLANVIYAQSTCKVLIPRIGDTYTGSCKKGLADGQGEAFGIDQYKGDFKKGFPDGSGSYIWQTGEIYKGEWKKGLRDGKGEYTFKQMGRDSVITGIWKEDKYLGKEAVAPYVIGYRNSIGRVSCLKVGTDRNYVDYKFSRSGVSTSNISISGLIMQGSSGTESVTTNFTGCEEVTFPFEGKIKFMAPNTLNTATLNCEVRLTINEPGAWVVTIFY